MADHVEEEPRSAESLLEKKLHRDDSSSSDEDEKESKLHTKLEASAEAVKTKIYRLFGREKPVHHILGGGKHADILLWRNKKISGTVLGSATAVWVLFELLEYHLLTLVCHSLIVSLTILFLWTNAANLISKPPPRIPEVVIPKETAEDVALALRYNLNRGLALLRDIVSERDLKNFLTVIAGLWVLSVVGSWCNFLTLFYIVFVLLHTVPVIYEKYDEKIDAFAEKAAIEIKKQYVVFDAKVLSKIPKSFSKDKKH